MDFKQDFDGTIRATFKPEEIATLVRVVRSSEEARITGLKEASRDVIKSVKEAEQALQEPTTLGQATPDQ